MHTIHKGANDNEAVDCPPLLLPLTRECHVLLHWLQVYFLNDAILHRPLQET